MCVTEGCVKFYQTFGATPFEIKSEEQQPHPTSPRGGGESGGSLNKTTENIIRKQI